VESREEIVRPMKTNVLPAIDRVINSMMLLLSKQRELTRFSVGALLESQLQRGALSRTRSTQRASCRGKDPGG
jgi:hypothetical protein